MEAKTREQHLQAQQSSGKTIVAYCTQHNLSPSTFYNWRFESKQKTIPVAQNPPKKSEAKFREVILPPPSHMKPALGYCVSTAGTGFTLTIPRGFDAEEVKSLLSLMSAKKA